jgi:hypothetical protein
VALYRYTYGDLGYWKDPYHFWRLVPDINSRLPHFQGHRHFRRSRTLPVVMLLSMSHLQVTTAHPDLCPVAWFTSRRVQPSWCCSWLTVTLSSSTWPSDGMTCHLKTSKGCWKMADTMWGQRADRYNQASSWYCHTAACTVMLQHVFWGIFMQSTSIPMRIVH